MSDPLKRIKRALIANHYQFSLKAVEELEADGLERADAIAAILTASRITKTFRSTSSFRVSQREYLYVIVGESLDGINIYTKGKLVAENGVQTYYFLISSKRSTT